MPSNSWFGQSIIITKTANYTTWKGLWTDWTVYLAVRHGTPSCWNHTSSTPISSLFDTNDEKFKSCVNFGASSKAVEAHSYDLIFISISIVHTLGITKKATILIINFVFSMKITSLKHPLHWLIYINTCSEYTLE